MRTIKKFDNRVSDYRLTSLISISRFDRRMPTQTNTDHASSTKAGKKAIASNHGSGAQVCVRAGNNRLVSIQQSKSSFCAV